MKIEIKNLSKTYTNQKVLNNLNLDIVGNQLFTIVGDSGCGKTTLLNIMSLVLKPDESSMIEINNTDVFKLKEEERRDYRLKNTGYIFQSFNLFDDDTVHNNLLLILESLTNNSKSVNETKICEALKELDILNLQNKYVKELSGGEKQRVAIARAIINDPKIVFADEPTGSLDEVNSEIVFSMLKKISQKRLVIIVTHDNYLAEKFSDTIFNLSLMDLQLINKKEFKKDLVKNKNIIKRPSISLRFIFKRFINLFRIRKFRSILTLSFLILSLFSISISLTLEDTITSAIKQSITSIIGGNDIIVKKKNETSQIIDFYPAEYNKVKQIYDDYKSDLEYIGVCYLNNFEEFFIDQNSVSNISRPISQNIEELNFRSFMEFNYLSSKDYKIYPNNINNLNYEEIFLSLNFSLLKKICRYLTIEVSYESLGNYIKNNNLVFNLNLENDNWGYIDNVSFLVKGIIESNKVEVYHTKADFNENLMEKSLMFPSTINLKKQYDEPWMLKKIYYVKTKDFQSNFLNKIFTNKNYANYIFENDSELYNPHYFSQYDKNIYTNKLFVYEIYDNSIPYLLPNQIKNINTDFNRFYYSTNNGYLNLGNSLYSGFSNRTFFSKNKDKLLEIVDAYSKIDYGDEIYLDKGILESYVLNPDDNSVKFSTYSENLKSGTMPTKINDVVLSSSMVSQLGIDLNNSFYLLSLEDKKENNYKIIELNLSGIIESNKPKLFVDSVFSISLFRDLLKFSCFNLLPNSIVYEFNKKPSSEEIKVLNNHFINYEFVDPISSLDAGVNETINYLCYLMIGISLISILVSIIILIIIVYIQIIESKKDFSILGYLGFRNSEIVNLQVSISSITLLIAFAISVLLYTIFNKFIYIIVGQTLGVMVPYILNSSIILFLLVVLILLIVIVYIVSKKEIKKIDIMKEIH